MLSNTYWTQCTFSASFTFIRQTRWPKWLFESSKSTDMTRHSSYFILVYKLLDILACVCIPRTEKLRIVLKAFSLYVSDLIVSLKISYCKPVNYKISQLPFRLLYWSTLSFFPDLFLFLHWSSKASHSISYFFLSPVSSRYQVTYHSFFWL